MSAARRANCVVALLILLSVGPRAVAQIGVSGGRTQSGGPTGTGPINTRNSVNMNEGEDPLKKVDRLRKTAEQFLKRGIEQREKNRLTSAVASFKAAFTNAAQAVGGQIVDKGLADQALEHLKSIYEEGKKKLEEAITLYEGRKYVESLELAGRVRIMYPGVLNGIPGMGTMPNLATQAVELEKKIESDPLAEPQLAQAKAAALVKRLARQEIEAKKDPKKRLELYNTLKTLAEKYPSSDAGKSAAERLAVMRADASFMQWVETETEMRRIKGDLASADQYEKNGNPSAARKIIDDLLKRYPGKNIEQIRAMVANRTG